MLEKTTKMQKCTYIYHRNVVWLLMFTNRICLQLMANQKQNIFNRPFQLETALTLFTFWLTFILSLSPFNQVLWFIVEGYLYFALIIGCYWKDEFHWFCGWLGALLVQTIDCQHALCWARINTCESSPLLFIYFCLHWLKHAIVQGLLSHWG